MEDYHNRILNDLCWQQIFMTMEGWMLDVNIEQLYVHSLNNSVISGKCDITYMLGVFKAILILWVISSDLIQNCTNTWSKVVVLKSR